MITHRRCTTTFVIAYPLPPTSYPSPPLIRNRHQTHRSFAVAANPLPPQPRCHRSPPQLTLQSAPSLSCNCRSLAAAAHLSKPLTHSRGRHRRCHPPQLTRCRSAPSMPPLITRARSAFDIGNSLQLRAYADGAAGGGGGGLAATTNERWRRVNDQRLPTNLSSVHATVDRTRPFRIRHR